jgi:site-specific recombinase XerD
MKLNALNSDFARLVQNFFGQRLIAQRNASIQTIRSYRDTFKLLLRYADKRLKKPPETLVLADIDAPFILGFLDHLERDRGNCAASRNIRFAAIRSFLRYAVSVDPTCLQLVQRVLAIPMKRFDKSLVGFLSRDEINAILSAPNPQTWSGQRDQAMFETLYNTGARVSEIIGLCVKDLNLHRAACVHIHGKGRKERAVPLWRSTTRTLRSWLTRIVTTPESPVFPNRTGKPMSRSGVEDRLRVAVREAAMRCSSLKNRNVTPHVIRHTTAMHMLQSDVDITLIALWLGHETIATTHLYIEADLAMKERALKKLQEPETKGTRYRPQKGLLAFLENL